MRKDLSAIEKNRVSQGSFNSPIGAPFGLFFFHRNGVRFRVIFGDGGGWEHASIVALSKNGERTPTWDEMCFIKDLFWEKEETVIQFHPAEKDYINNHPHCLHLWRPTESEIPTPPSCFVGFKK